jgi:hypothetical protein
MAARLAQRVPWPPHRFLERLAAEHAEAIGGAAGKARAVLCGRGSARAWLVNRRWHTASSCVLPTATSQRLYASCCPRRYAVGPCWVLGERGVEGCPRCGGGAGPGPASPRPGPCPAEQHARRVGPPLGQRDAGSWPPMPISAFTTHLVEAHVQQLFLGLHKGQARLLSNSPRLRQLCGVKACCAGVGWRRRRLPACSCLLPGPTPTLQS